MSVSNFGSPPSASDAVNSGGPSIGPSSSVLVDAGDYGNVESCGVCTKIGVSIGSGANPLQVQAHS